MNLLKVILIFLGPILQGHFGVNLSYASLLSILIGWKIEQPIKMLKNERKFTLKFIYRFGPWIPLLQDIFNAFKIF